MRPRWPSEEWSRSACKLLRSNRLRPQWAARRHGKAAAAMVVAAAEDVVVAVVVMLGVAAAGVAVADGRVMRLG